MDTINWLLKGDVSIQYQTRRDLLKENSKSLHSLRKGIEREGWGKRFLALRKENGHWGEGFYRPKWTCTHYTLLDLKAIGIDPDNRLCRESTQLLLTAGEGVDGGVNYARTVKHSDVCINGMVLGLASYFPLENPRIIKIVDYLLDRHMTDGGWNCQYFKGDKHSSFHTTINVLEGLFEFSQTGNEYRKEEINEVIDQACHFLLEHKLFRSHRTGQVVDKKMLKLAFPVRWRYDILRALEFFRAIKMPYQENMAGALEIILSARDRDGRWPLQARHPGRVHFDMEIPGQPSRWNTLRALKILEFYG